MFGAAYLPFIQGSFISLKRVKCWGGDESSRLANALMLEEKSSQGLV